MRKRVFSIPAIISLILMAAVVVFWHRGNRVRDFARITWAEADGRIELASLEYGMAVRFQSAHSPKFHWSSGDFVHNTSHNSVFESVRVPLQNDGYYGWSPIGSVIDRSLLGFSYLGGNGLFVLIVPQWFLLVVTTLKPVWDLCHLWRARRRGFRGLCEHCGYDLRYTPDRCPECGQAVQLPEEPAAAASSP
jgi:hypothetical protein